MTKKALVVGINDYSNWQFDPNYFFPNLHACISDANAFAAVLPDALGFQPQDITVLTDAQATSDAILGTLTNTLATLQAGDVMCFYFSGHGDRVPEDGWNGTSPRFYETFMPYDRQGNTTTGITSAQIANIAQALRPSEINFTLVLDSCHSGGLYLSADPTGIRSVQTNSATRDAIAARCNTIVPHICLPDPDEVAGNVSSLTVSGDAVSMFIDPSKDNPIDAKATLLSACNYNELAGESSSISHGYFTYAILQTINASNFSMTYTDFLAALRTQIAGITATQTPQLRGRPVRLEENLMAGWNFSI